MAQVARKKKPGLMGEEDLSKSQLPKRSLWLDANVATLTLTLALALALALALTLTLTLTLTR